MIGDWQYSVTEGRQCVSDQEQCCWPGCPKPSGDQYPAVPMCTVHAKVTAHQVQIPQLNRYSQHLKQHCPGQGD